MSELLLVAASPADRCSMSCSYLSHAAYWAPWLCLRVWMAPYEPTVILRLRRRMYTMNQCSNCLARATTKLADFSVLPSLRTGALARHMIAVRATDRLYLVVGEPATKTRPMSMVLEKYAP